mmetsp:Transcript_145039/g.368022  ORF Transcript_145039/g.368022 Transcript_145039/m.368022 type:complete len:1105 (+) Transcript_145039:115-3429(+)
MAPVDEAEALAVLPPLPQPADIRANGRCDQRELDEWVQNVDDVSAQIKGIIDGTLTDFEALDHNMAIKERAKQIRHEELLQKRNRFFLYGNEGKGEGTKYKWWCKRCFVEYLIDLPQNTCTRCKQADKMMTQQERRDELMGKLEDYKKVRSSHQWRKDKWIRWKKSQALLGRSRNINYKAWEYWEPDTDTEDEGDPIVPRDNPEFLAMEADIKDRHKKAAEKSKTSEKCRERGNQCMKDGDFVGAIEHYEEGLEYKRDNKALWTNKALAELKVFRWHDAVASCNKVIEYSEIFEDGFKRSSDACFKAFMRRAAALRALHRWAEAVEDLEDAVKLFPKDKEARDLLEKTKAALREADQVQSLQAADATPAASEEAAPQGPVRIEIEESEDESDDDGANGASLSAAPSSLAGLSRSEFRSLLARLGREESERVLFCARRGGGGGGAAAARKEDTRKVDLKHVEEVLEPSRLDEAIKDVERCCVLFKKLQGNVVPLRADVKQLDGLDAQQKQEDKEARAFLRAAAPRAVAVLHVLAGSGSDHHCALTAPAVRHVWPLLACDEWRHPVLELLLEWSQRTISAKAMAEFAARHPEPHLRLLIDAVTTESKENMLPPGFEDRAKQASERFGADAGGAEALDSLFDEMVVGLSKSSPAELAVSILGNMCLPGQSIPAFRDVMAPFRVALVPALARQLKPMNWRLCGRSAGAVCNLLRLGDAFATAVEEECTKPLVTALRDEVGEADTSDGGSQPRSATPLMQALRAASGGGDAQMPGAKIPGMDGSAAKLLAALVNLLTVRPGSAQQLLDLGLLDVAVPVMDVEKASACVAPGASGEDGAEEVAARAALLVGRLLARAPAALSTRREDQLLRHIEGSLSGGRALVRAATAAAAAGGGDAEGIDKQGVERLELKVRMLAILVTKTPGALDRLTQRAPRVEELPDDAAVGQLDPEGGPAICFDRLVSRLVEIATAARPREHVAPDAASGPLSRLRGNLALLFGALCEAQAADNAPPALRGIDLAPLAEPFIDALRKESGGVQNNIGIFITKLAQNPRYKQKVRDLNGLESLHQIQLPRVEAQKAEATRKHRVETDSAARQAEVRRARSFRGLD